MKNNNNVPELLAPAGSFDCLKAAVSNGADAVYLGLKKGSARMGAENFTFEQLEEAVSYAHLYGVKIYLALNTLFSDDELFSAYDDAKKAASIGVDAIIIQDVGLAQMIMRNRDDFPCEIHASTQMSIFNPNGLHFLEDMGFDRCITARELSIDEIKKLCQSSRMAIEVFCHGALCMSVSGQCLLSSFIGGRSGNRGTCAQPCRMKYSLQKKGDYTKAPAYRLSPADFASLPYLRELVSAGVHSLKIEGRLKSPEYVAQVTKSYRQALDFIAYNADSAAAATEFYSPEKDMYNMQLLFGRGDFTSGYLNGKLPFSDITFHTSGRIGVKIGKMKNLPVRLPAPRNLPENLTRFKINVVLNENVSLRPGDGITVYDKNNEFKVVCGGTVNNVSASNMQKCKKSKSYVSCETELIIVGKIYTKLNCYGSDCNFILAITDDSVLRDELKSSSAECKKIPVEIRFDAKVSQFPILTISDKSGNSATVSGDKIIAEAQKTPTSEDDIIKQLKKLGDTPYFTIKTHVNADDNIFIPISYVNDLRRRAVSILSEKRSSHRNVARIFPQNISPVPSSEIAAKTSFFFYRAESFVDFNNSKLPDFFKEYKKDTHIYYLPINAFYEAKKNTDLFRRICSKIDNLKSNSDCKIVAYFNFISFGGTYTGEAKELPFILENYFGKYIDGFMLENPGDIYTLKNAIDSLPVTIQKKPIICCDYSFNVANSEASGVLNTFGVNICTLSPEDVYDFNIEKMKVTPEIIIGGKIILMRSRHCYIDEGECGGKKSKCMSGDFSLIDSQNCVFPILPQREDCCSILLSHKDVAFSQSDVKKIRTRYPRATLRINIY